MTVTKICGVTRADDTILAVDLGARLVGLNFYPPSPRYLAPERAAELVAEVRRSRPAADVRWVGVFVDEDPATVRRISRDVPLDLVQLHGDEDLAYAERLGSDFTARIVKVFRVRARVDREHLFAQMEPWRRLGVWGFLVDTKHDDLYGGTGTTWDFASLGRSDSSPANDSDDETAPLRLLLAGGLGPETVRDALEACRPWGVDLCSGVEAKPGIKDPDLMRRLFEEIRHGTTRTAA